MISEVDLKSLWHELDDYTAVLDKESKDLKEIWVKIAEIKSETDKETQQ